MSEDRIKSGVQFRLFHLVIAVAASGFVLALFRLYGRDALPVVFFPSGVVGTIALLRVTGYLDIAWVWVGGAIGGAIGLGSAGFILGMLDPPPGTAYKWFGTGGLPAASFGLAFYGVVGCIPGALFGVLSGRLLRRAEKAGASITLTFSLSFLLVFACSALFFGLGSTTE